MDATPNSVPSVQEYFPELGGDLTKLTWAHAVNSQEKLSAAVEDDKVMMLEADVIMGKLIGHDEVIPVMGHPPATKSDLSLQQFIEEIITVQENKKKGIKLDFKSTEVFKGSLEVIDSLSNKLTFPVWLNADILSGPVNSDGKPVDADTFLKSSASQFPTTTLSVGWTTKYGPLTHGEYTEEQLNEMKSAIERNNIVQPVTLAVRAGIVAESRSRIIALVEEIDEFQKSNTTTLTIWMSTDTDPVNVPKLRDLILTLHKSRVYLDVPEVLRKELNLDNGSTKNIFSVLQGTVVALLTSVPGVFSNILKLFRLKDYIW